MLNLLFADLDEEPVNQSFHETRKDDLAFFFPNLAWDPSTPSTAGVDFPYVEVAFSERRRRSVIKTAAKHRRTWH